MEEIRAISAVNSGRPLSAEEKAEVARLVARDREVRIHEAQHAAAAGAMASGVQYDYEMGPDGKMYAVGGKVRLTVTSGQTPEETLAKARQLRAAANAPADPSGQDLAVAAQASQMEAEALQKIARRQTEHGSRVPGSHLPPLVARFGSQSLNFGRARARSHFLRRAHRVLTAALFCLGQSILEPANHPSTVGVAGSPKFSVPFA